MHFMPGSIDQLSQIISQVVAPAFLLGAVASFVSILATRMNGVIERMRYINDLPPEGHAKSRLKQDLPRLRRRVDLLQRSLLFAIASGVAGALLIVVAFGAALLHRDHVWGTALLFTASMALLSISLGLLASEVRIGLNEFDPQ